MQCKDRDQLDWSPINHDEIKILIPKAVINEIDSFKNGPAGRRARRARNISGGLFRNLLTVSPQTINCSGKKIYIEFPGPLQLDKKHNQFLDLSKKDDLIANEILAWKVDHPDEQVIGLTHDTGLLLTFKHCGIDSVIIPDDWLLNDENDERDKKILELENENKALKVVLPKLTLEAYLDSVPISPGSTSDICEVKYVPLTSGKIKEITDRVFLSAPLKTDFSDQQKPPHAPLTVLLLAGLQTWEPPSEREILNYSEQYDEWQTNVYQFFEKLHEHLNAIENTCKINITLRNEGGAPAEDLIVEFKLAGRMEFIPEDIDEESEFNRSAKEECVRSELKLPKPPRPPEGRSFNVLEGITQALSICSPLIGGQNAVMSNLFHTRKGRHDFYDSVITKQTIRYECSEFRHRLASQEIQLLLTCAEDERTKNARLLCSVSARNLTNIDEFFFNFKINQVTKTLDEYVDKLLQQTDTMAWRIECGDIMLSE